MKIFLAVVAFLIGAGVYALTDEQLRKADEHTKYCSEKAGVDYESATNFRYSVITDEAEVNQCFSKCFFERSGFMNEDGVMQKDVMYAKLGFEKDEDTKAKLLKLIEKCTVLTGENLCNTAFKVHNCYWSHIAESA